MVVEALRRQVYRSRDTREVARRAALDASSERNRIGSTDLADVTPAFTIPRGDGFLKVDSLDPALIAECVADTKRRFEDERTRNQQLNRKPYFIEFTGLQDYAPDSAPFRLATSPGVVRAVADYLGSFPQLHNITSVFSPSSEETGATSWKGSQLFHRDGADRNLVKIWVLCSDVADDNGPTMILPADLSQRLALRMRYVPGTKLDDEPFLPHWDRLAAATGPEGTVYATDTAGCFHFGSRTEKESSRLVLMIHYMTHHSDSFDATSRTRATGEGLAVPPDDLTPMQRRLLGVF